MACVYSLHVGIDSMLVLLSKLVLGDDVNDFVVLDVNVSLATGVRSALLIPRRWARLLRCR